MKFLFSLLCILPVLAFATTPAETEFALNRLSGVARKYSLGSLIHQTRNVAIGKYSFAKQGGAVGAINLWKDLNGGNVTDNYTSIPDNAVIQNVTVDVLTVPAGSTATGAGIKVELVNDADLYANTSLASFTGKLLGIPDFATAADWIKLTADKQLKIEVVNVALTSGIFNVYVDYILGD